MRIIFLGTPNYLDPIIKSLDEHFDLVKTIRKTDDLNHETMKQLNNLQPDLLVVASFGKIIPQQILQVPKLGAINIHPSKLPKYRGPSPIQSQILQGITDSAISFILMDEEVDHGPIIYQEPFQILGTDTFESLLHKMFGASAALIPTVIKSFVDKKLVPLPQNDQEATYCKEIKKEDGYFDINNPPSPERLDEMTRAFHPWPGCWTKWNGKIVKLLPNPHVIARGESPVDSRVPEATWQSRFLFQMEGKKAVPLKDFLNGYPNFPFKERLSA